MWWASTLFFRSSIKHGTLVARRLHRCIPINGGSHLPRAATGLSVCRPAPFHALARTNQCGTPSHRTRTLYRRLFVARLYGWRRTSRLTTVTNADSRHRLTLEVWIRPDRGVVLHCTGATRIMPGSHLSGRHPLVHEGVNSGRHLGSIPICGRAGSCALYGACCILERDACRLCSHVFFIL